MSDTKIDERVMSAFELARDEAEMQVLFAALRSGLSERGLITYGDAIERMLSEAQRLLEKRQEQNDPATNYGCW